MFETPIENFFEKPNTRDYKNSNFEIRFVFNGLVPSSFRKKFEFTI